jgi:hypothetical protein
LCSKRRRKVELKHVGLLGLVLGLAVYGCGDDATKGGGGNTGGDAGAATGGASTGGAATGGAATGGAAMGGGGMGGMGGMGGATCQVNTAPETIEAACEARCGVHACLAAADADCAAAYFETCEADCLDEADLADGDGCSAEYLAFVSCEAATPAQPSNFQCSGYIFAPNCEDEGDTYTSCWMNAAP